MNHTQTADVRAIALSLLIPSHTEAQAARRKHFDKAALQQLADSIKSAGLLNPILVRPSGASFEIVAGERRFQAAKLAELDEVLVSVRDLSDDQVLELQLIENLQREGLHELHEAEGYEQLRKRGMSADEIAEKVGRSREYVYGRMKLLALSKDARAAFYDGKLNASTALLIARIPNEKQQREALKEIAGDSRNEPMSYRDAQHHVQSNYMLRLSDAPFDIKVEDLVRGAVACGRCPKNTIAQQSLFGDVKASSAGVCTDIACFRSKATATIELRLKAAATSGQEVITGKKAKEIFPYDGCDARAGFVSLDQDVWANGAYKKARSFVDKETPVTLVRTTDRDGQEQLVEVVPETAVRKAQKAKGGRSSSASEQSAAEKKAKLETKIRKAVYAKVREKHPPKLGRRELELVASTLLHRLWDDNRKQVSALWMPESEKGSAYEKINDLEKKLPKLTDAEIARLLLDCVHVGELRCGGYNDEKPELLIAAAKKARVDVDAIRKELTPQKKAKVAKKAKSKKA